MKTVITAATAVAILVTAATITTISSYHLPTEGCDPAQSAVRIETGLHPDLRNEPTTKIYTMKTLLYG